MKPLYTKHRTIGLLGGSFNPAHAGHLHISLHALNALGFDEVWWLVSPQNPLKEKNTLADYRARLDSAKNIAAAHRHIYVSDIEAHHRTRYSYQTVALLRKKFAGTKFTWLMGADNLAQFHRWRRWKTLLRTLPLVVFDRAPYSYTSLASVAYQRMRRFLFNNTRPRGKALTPALRFVHLKRHPASATFLRKTLGAGAFLGHNKNKRDT